MPKMVFYVGDGKPRAEHVHRARVPEAVRGFKFFQAFRRQGRRQVFFADTINSMPCELLSALINKKALAEQRFWRIAKFGDIQLKQTNAFRPKRDLP